MFILPACSLLSPQIIEKIVTVTETKDSLIFRDRIIHDTVKFEVPIIIENNVTRDDSSHLENAFAISDARVKDGLLYHSLRTKPHTIDIPVDIHVTDTTHIHEKTEKTDSTRTIVEYVEKPLSWAKKAKLDLFPWLLGAVIALLGWVTKRWWLPLIK